ncbi:MAG: hypothetical protein CVV28_09970 [Methanobacteriales archaeon HGW-Methanobacteriales-1]|jgi:transposase-like protein/ribosomal protein L40E|nr:MAG: hypothetical protein CVV28_09970 [Methanobacteriales archaeon HGW-Methanobacteriales-1]
MGFNGGMLMIYCEKCGFENPDDAKICINCFYNLKSKFNNDNIDKKTKTRQKRDLNFDSEIGKIKKSLERNSKSLSLRNKKCPICENGKLKKYGGFINEGGYMNKYRCNECHALLVQNGDNYKLSEISDQNYPKWQKYAKATLSKSAWIRIAYGLNQGKETSKQTKKIDDSINQIKKSNIPVPNKKPTIQESNLKGTCAVCGSVNPENSKFCMKCGRSLDGNSGNYCSRCGTSNMTGAAFCKECGQNMVMINTPPQYQGPAKNYDGLNPLEFLLIVFFSPIAGLIGFVAWHDTKPRKAKISLIIAIIMFFIFVPILMLYLNWRAQMDYYDSLYYPYCVLTSFYAL